MSIPLIYQEDLAETIIVKRTQRIHIPYNEKVSYFCHLYKQLKLSKEFVESGSPFDIWICLKK